MAPWQAALTTANVALLLLFLLGLVRRGRVRRLYCLPAYAGATALAAAGALLWPERLHVWSFWLAKETVIRLLGLALMVEMLLTVFDRMPTARRAARRAATCGLACMLGTLACVRAPAAGAAGEADPVMLLLIADVLPRLALASALLALSLLVVTLAYAVPLDPLHRAVIYGFVPYVTLYALAVGAMGGAAQHALANLATGTAYLLMLLLWAHAAWRREPDPPVPREVVSWVHPWR